mgnify:CR=1 FL=1
MEENKIEETKERLRTLETVEKEIIQNNNAIDVLKKTKMEILDDLKELGHPFNPKLCEEEILLDRVFGRLMNTYQKANESIIYDVGIGLMLTVNFLMTTYLVVTVISN